MGEENDVGRPVGFTPQAPATGEDTGDHTGDHTGEGAARSHPVGASPVAQAKKVWGVAKGLDDVVTPTNVLTAVVALVIVAVGGSGGFGLADQGPASDVPVAKAQQVVQAEPFSLSIKKIWWAESVRNLLPRDPDKRVIGVVGWASNTTDTHVPASVLVDALRADIPGCVVDGRPAGPDTCRPAIVYRDDSLQMGSLQPGLGKRFAAIFYQSRTSPAPSRTVVTVRAQTHRESTLDGSMVWADPEDVAAVPLPVAEVAP